MNTKFLSEKALSVIHQYLNFQGISIPYFNNRHSGAKMKLRAQAGKGSPRDIFDEMESLAIREKIDLKSLNANNLKKFLVDHDIGIDCSGLVYYILNAESEARGTGTLDRHLCFPFCKGIFGKAVCKMRPVENAGVSTLAHEKNSREINIKDAQPGDIITMIGETTGEKRTGNIRNHILIIHQIEYQNFIPTIFHYTHSIAWPEDGEYEHGVRQEKIEIMDIDKSISQQKWSESRTFNKAVNSITTLRRLLFL